MNTNKTYYRGILKIVVAAKNRDEAYAKIEQEVEETLNFEDKGMGLLLDQMEVKIISEEDEPIATYQLCWADVEPALTEQGLAFSGLTAEQKADIARLTQKGMDAYMDDWQEMIIDDAVRQALEK